MIEIPMRDTPALDVRERRKGLAHIDPARLAAAQDLLRAAKQMLRAFGEAFASHGLSPGRYAVLMALDAQRGGLAPSELAERLGVSRPTVTGLVDGLTRDGLVAHAADPDDRRRKAVALTGAGEALLDVVAPDIFQRMVDLTASLTDSERRTAVRLMGKVEGGLMAVAPGADRAKEPS